MKPDFMDRITKIMVEIRTVTFIDKIDTKGIEDILQDELKEYSDELHAYYDAGYDAAYDEGHSDGYYEGYSEGYLAFNRSTS